MPRRPSSKPQVVQVPNSLEEADRIIREIGEAQREIQLIEVSTAEGIDALKAEAVKETRPYQERIDQLVAALFAFAESHRGELTQQGKTKTVKVPSGQFGWRLPPPSLSLKRPVEEVVAALKSLRLTRFIRREIRETVDRKALSSRPDVVARLEGVEIQQDELFEVRPAAVGVTIGKPVEQLKKPASG